MATTPRPSASPRRHWTICCGNRSPVNQHGRRPEAPGAQRPRDCDPQPIRGVLPVRSSKDRSPAAAVIAVLTKNGNWYLDLPPAGGVEMVAVSWRWRSVQGDGGHPCHPVRLVLERYLGGGYGDWGRYRMLLLLITTRVAELGGSGTLDQRPRHIRYQNCRRPGQERENRRTTRLRRVPPPAAASSAPERVPPSPLRGSKNSMIPAPVRSVPKTRTVGALRLPTSMRRACDRFNPLVGMVP